MRKIVVQSDRNSRHERKKAGQVELARTLDANVRVTNVCVLSAAYRARVQGSLVFCDAVNGNCYS